MMNLFDLSAGMASTNMLTNQARRDGSLARRSRQDVGRTMDSDKVYAEDKIGATNRSPSSNRSNVSHMNTILAKEISEELELKKKSPSVVARLMGLEDDVPGQGPALHSSKRNLKKSHLNDNLEEPNRLLQPIEQYCYSNTTRDMHSGPKEIVEFKDVYEVSEEPLRTYHLQDQMFSRGMSSRSKSDIRMEIVRQKFMEAKLLSTNDRFLNSKKFQEAIEVLSSNRDLFLKFLEEPNTNFSKHLDGLHKMPTQPQTRRITVLKPNKSVESKGRREIRAHLMNDENEYVMSRTHRRSHSAEVTFSQPTRIVVLKPSPGKPNRTMAQLTPRAAPSQVTEQIDFYRCSEDDECLPDGLHRRDESLLSSVYSNGYVGDVSSFSSSEVDYVYEEGGNLSDSESEVVSRISQHSWDDIKKYNSPCSGSRFHRTPHSPESSEIREVKKRLSERWTPVAYDGTNQEQMQLPRRSSTLGEMLSLRESKKDVTGLNSISTSQPCHTDYELTLQATSVSKCREDERNGPCSQKNLARSKSVPVTSSMFNNIAPKDPSSNSEGCKTPKAVTRLDKGKSSLKGKVSSFFFPKSKRQSKEKNSLSSASSDERIEVTCLGNMEPKADEIIGADENMSFSEEKDDYSTTQTISSLKDIVSFDVPISSNCSSGDLDGLRSSGGLKSIRHEPSPISVLDASFEDSNTNESESSRSITCSNGRVALPSTVESITHSLSWEDMSSPSPGSTKLAPLSNVSDDELECVTFVQKILSSAGLDNLQLGKVFSRWHLPDCPLDPGLCDELLDHKEEAAKSRERRSNQKLLFDCVNMSLIEIGEDALLCIGHWSQACSTACEETLSQVLGVVPRHMRDWLYGSGKFLLNEDDDSGTILERIVQQDVEGRGWIKLMRWELDEITMQIAWEILEELVEEAMDDLAICSLEQHTLVEISNL